MGLFLLEERFWCVLWNHPAGSQTSARSRLSEIALASGVKHQTTFTGNLDPLTLVKRKWQRLPSDDLYTSLDHQHLGVCWIRQSTHLENGTGDTDRHLFGNDRVSLPLGLHLEVSSTRLQDDGVIGQRLKASTGTKFHHPACGIDQHHFTSDTGDLLAQPDPLIRDSRAKIDHFASQFDTALPLHRTKGQQGIQFADLGG